LAVLLAETGGDWASAASGATTLIATTSAEKLGRSDCMDFHSR